jgi:ABC-2 type transport system permease protein
MGAILRYLSLTEHFGEMVKGIIDTRDVVYFVTVIVLGLFLTQRSVESLRWR